jgi:hypothetical protein
MWQLAIDYWETPYRVLASIIIPTAALAEAKIRTRSLPTGTLGA